MNYLSSPTIAVPLSKLSEVEEIERKLENSARALSDDEDNLRLSEQVSEVVIIHHLTEADHPEAAKRYLQGVMSAALESLADPDNGSKSEIEVFSREQVLAVCRGRIAASLAHPSQANETVTIAEAFRRDVLTLDEDTRKRLAASKNFRFRSTSSTTPCTSFCDLGVWSVSSGSKAGQAKDEDTYLDRSMMKEPTLEMVMDEVAASVETTSVQKDKIASKARTLLNDQQTKSNSPVSKDQADRIRVLLDWALDLATHDDHPQLPSWVIPGAERLSSFLSRPVKSEEMMMKNIGVKHLSGRIECVDKKVSSYALSIDEPNPSLRVHQQDDGTWIIMDKEGSKTLGVMSSKESSVTIDRTAYTLGEPEATPPESKSSEYASGSIVSRLAVPTLELSEPSDTKEHAIAVFKIPTKEEALKAVLGIGP